jgi:hypothetical protein
MRAWWRRTRRRARAADAWITREFTGRGLAPPHCTPEALARVLERERQITIAFRPHASEDPGVYGLLYRPVGCERTYIIVFRPTQSLVLRRLILFHELAHLLFAHPLTEVAGAGTLRGYMVSDDDDAMAEAFAVGAMQYSFDDEAPRQRTDMADDVALSALGHFLQQRIAYWP